MVKEVVAALRFADLPECAAIVNRLQRWAESHPEVSRLVVYGSRARGEQRPDSDFDLAVEIVPGPTDSGAFAVWMFDGKQWASELKPMVPWPLQLEWHDVDGTTPTVSRGIATGHYVAFDRGIRTG